MCVHVCVHLESNWNDYVSMAIQLAPELLEAHCQKVLPMRTQVMLAAHDWTCSKHIEWPLCTPVTLILPPAATQTRSYKKSLASSYSCDTNQQRLQYTNWIAAGMCKSSHGSISWINPAWQYLSKFTLNQSPSSIGREPWQELLGRCMYLLKSDMGWSTLVLVLKYT